MQADSSKSQNEGSTGLRKLWIGSGAVILAALGAAVLNRVLLPQGGMQPEVWMGVSIAMLWCYGWMRPGGSMVELVVTRKEQRVLLQEEKAEGDWLYHWLPIMALAATVLLFKAEDVLDLFLFERYLPAFFAMFSGMSLMMMERVVFRYSAPAGVVLVFMGLGYAIGGMAFPEIREVPEVGMAGMFTMGPLAGAVWVTLSLWERGRRGTPDERCGERGRGAGS